jgi:hypothetical protein
MVWVRSPSGLVKGPVSHAKFVTARAAGRVPKGCWSAFSASGLWTSVDQSPAAAQQPSGTPAVKNLAESISPASLEPSKKGGGTAGVVIAGVMAGAVVLAGKGCPKLLKPVGGSADEVARALAHQGDEVVEAAGRKGAQQALSESTGSVADDVSTLVNDVMQPLAEAREDGASAPPTAEPPS